MLRDGPKYIGTETTSAQTTSAEQQVGSSPDGCPSSELHDVINEGMDTMRRVQNVSPGLIAPSIREAHTRIRLLLLTIWSIQKPTIEDVQDAIYALLASHGVVENCGERQQWRRTA